MSPEGPASKGTFDDRDDHPVSPTAITFRKSRLKFARGMTLQTKKSHQKEKVKKYFWSVAGLVCLAIFRITNIAWHAPRAQNSTPAHAIPDTRRELLSSSLKVFRLLGGSRLLAIFFLELQVLWLHAFTA